MQARSLERIGREDGLALGDFLVSGENNVSGNGEQCDKQGREAEVVHGEVLVDDLKLKPGIARVNPKPAPINQHQSLLPILRSGTS